MRHVCRHLGVIAAAFGLGLCSPAQGQLLTVSDWLTHRGNPQRTGGNSDAGILPDQSNTADQSVWPQLGPSWVYPASRDMPAEMVSDNTVLASATLFPTKSGAESTWDDRDYPAVQADGTILKTFGLKGSWVYPAVSRRMSGAWPPSDFTASKVGDYVYIDAVTDSTLATIGVDTLETLPNLSSANNDASAAIYKQIDDALKAAPAFARWTFGTRYPAGTLQGTVDVGSDANRCKLVPNQRYAAYIRFPASGTLENSNSATARPNTQHVMVRVSWGADVNDPKTSRIFMMDFSETGGYWKRIRTDSADDRYFPYGLKDPTKAFDANTNPYCPITVTLYNVTPDDQPGSSGIKSIVVADAVRLVPEALRGDIHASAASAVFPPNGVSNASVNEYYQLTYYGRDETSGPGILFPTATNYSTSVGSTGVLLDPTSAYDKDSNPIVFDPSQSIRSAVFYCMQDYFNKTDKSRNRYGQLRWRFPAWTTPVSAATIDDTAYPQDPNGEFVTSAGWSQLANLDHQPYGTSYQWAVGATTADQSATWKKTVYGTGTYTVLVWIPGGDTGGGIHYTKKAHYQIYSDTGVLDYYLDQRNTAVDTVTGTPLTSNGMWRTLATGVRFPSNVAKVVLDNLVPSDDATLSRSVVADAMQFVSESHSTSGVTAAPCVARVKWPSGKVRSVVYFGTTDGHVWALDAIGPDQDSNGDPLMPGAATSRTSTLTTPYWVYPSVSNPANVSTSPLPDPQQRLADGALDGLWDDPNWLPDSENNVQTQGIDGDVTGTTPNYTTKAPDLAAFSASPVFVETATRNVDLSYTYKQFLVIGNVNGRIYALDPVGRTSGGEPYSVTIASGDYPGVPGTTRRVMTWPTIARDKWLDKGGRQAGGSFSKYTDDNFGSQCEVLASPTVNKTSTPVDPSTGASVSDQIIACFANYASDGTGRVCAVDLADLRPSDRIANPNNDGESLWQFPEEDATGVAPITQPGAITTGGKFVFSAGGRVYCIAMPPATTTISGKTVMQPEWTYPYASAPGDPSETRPNDQQANENSFTAPIFRTGLTNVNSGNDVVFVGNRDGTVHGLDATSTGNPVAGPTVLFTSVTRGTSRASAIFMNSLPPQPTFSTSTAVPPTPSVPVVNNQAKPAIMLPNDAGGMVAFSPEDSGKIMWRLFDSGTGRVPVTQSDTSGNSVTTAVATSSAYRGADAILANGWVYNGDEGNQDIGEINGQMRAYADTQVTGGMSTPDEPYYPPGGDANGSLDLRLVELWNGVEDDATTPYQYFGSTDATRWVSPYDAWVDGKRKADNLTPPGMVVYEWGDDIVVAAWGAYTGNILPTVTFTLQGGSQTVAPVTVGAIRDRKWDSGGLTIEGVGTALGWVAKATFPFRKPSDTNDQAPGRKYTVQVRAQLSASSGAIFTTNQLMPGQAYVTKTSANPPSGQDENTPVTGTARLMAVAHPLAITTVGVPSDPSAAGSMGWYSFVTNTSYTQLMANGNRLSLISGSSISLDSKAKGLVAPVGFLPHGSSGTYLGGDGRALLMIADRSSLWKRNDPLGNVRVERKGLEWGWNSNDSSLSTLQKNTGNVMNPLPWETFPLKYPNTSADYPDMDLTRTTLRAGTIDMARSGVTLPLPTITKDTSGVITAKTLRPQTIDMTVSVPRYQSANINHWYTDINNEKQKNLAGPPYAANPSPSAGYYGNIAVYVGTGSASRYRGTSFSAQQQVATGTSREDVYREFMVGVGVPPDINLRTEEQTIDLGNEAHGLGFAPGIPFAPSGIGPYPVADNNNYDRFFAPFTVRNQGNVNLINLRVAKVVGAEANIANPASWLALQSDQVDAVVALLGGGLVWMRPFNVVGPVAAGNRGVVTTLDHSRRSGAYDLETDYSAAPYGSTNLWPFNSSNPYVTSGNVLGWPAGTEARPTLNKPRPGDVSATTMSVPAVAYGDPDDFLSGKGDTRPKIGVAVPVGTPAGTYSAKVYVYEDSYPEQWIAYAGGSGGPLNGYASGSGGLNDGILNGALTPVAGRLTGAPLEAVVQNPFTLKVTVREARLTNEQPGTKLVPGPDIGNYWQIDARNGAVPLGANFAPAAVRDAATGDLILFWASNRQWSGSSWVAPTVQDTPVSLFFSQLNSVSGSGLFDWRYETGGTRWWNPVANNASYPDIASSTEWFPSTEVSGQPWLPAVPGTLVPSGVAGLPMTRHGSPALVQDESSPRRTWLFWQGYAYKNMGDGSSAYNLDSRTFYAQVSKGNNGVWAPAAMAPSSGPLSFRNDPQLAKMSPKPMMLVDQGGTSRNYLFWHGAGAGGNRLFYNLANGNLTALTPAAWQTDVALATPGGLQSVSDPTPVRRTVWWDTRVTPRWITDTSTVSGGSFGRFVTAYDVDPDLGSASSALVDAIDLMYTAVSPRRKQPETFMTRYRVLDNGRLQVMALPPVENELMVRDGTTNTWMSRDVAWLYRGTSGYTDGNGHPWMMIKVNGQEANQVSGVQYDSTTGRLVFQAASVSLNGGRTLSGLISVDPQLGTVTFLDAAPGLGDSVTISYIPQTMRVNVTRNEAGVVCAPSGWENDPGVAPKPYVAASGGNSEPCSFLDTYPNPRWVQNADAFFRVNGQPTQSAGETQVTRLWTLFRKTGTSTSASALFYSARRLMVRLPRGVVRTLTDSGTYTIAGNIVVTGNRGPYEVDWIRGRVYFTQVDEGNLVNITFAYGRDSTSGALQTVSAGAYRVGWGDEISVGSLPIGSALGAGTDQTTSEVLLPTEAAVNEGQVSAFRDPVEAKVWVFWTSTRSGTTDLYNMTLSPQFYLQPAN